MKSPLFSVFLFLIGLLSVQVGLAQNTLDLSSSGGISFRLSKEGTPGRILSKGEKLGFAYRFGAAYSLRLQEHMALSIGGQYASYSSWRPLNLTTTNGQRNIEAFIDRTHLIEVPISIRKMIGDKKRFYFHGGLTPSLHLRYMNIQKYDNGDRERQENQFNDFENFQLAIHTGFGMDFPLSEKLILFTQLNGQVHLLEEVKNSGLRWWDVSCQVGLRVAL